MNFNDIKILSIIKKMRIKNVTVIIIVLLTIKLNAQKMLTIEEVNEMAIKNSNKIKIIENNSTKTTIESSFYRLSLLPKITTTISLPYQRSIAEVIQSDGSLRFVERNFLNSSLNLNISQALPFTGGTLNVTSSINNARDFNNKTSNFSSNWANISYQQTINGFNSFKWNKKLNPLYNKKDSISFLKEKIQLKYDVSKLYSEVQLISLKTELFKSNIDKTQKLLLELEEKFKLGRVLKIDVDQVKITLEQLKRQFEINNLEYLSGIQSLKNAINIDNQENYILKPITENNFEIDKKTLEITIKKNGFEINRLIKLLESNSNIDKVKKEGAIAVSLQLGMGLNSSSNEFSNLYETPAQSQFVTLGTKIPILDWGKSSKKLAIAKLEKENIEYEIRDNENKIEEQINDLLNYHLSLKSQIKSLVEQLKLTNTINEMFEELLKLGRKTIAEYKAQLVETFNIVIEHQKGINNLYLLKLKIDEITLTL
jgi:outer membrane protein